VSTTFARRLNFQVIWRCRCEHQLRRGAVRAVAQRGGHAHPLPVELVPQHRRFPPGRPGGAHYLGQQDPADGSETAPRASPSLEFLPYAPPPDEAFYLASRQIELCVERIVTSAAGRPPASPALRGAEQPAAAERPPDAVTGSA
jgi:hypothetical protein